MNRPPVAPAPIALGLQLASALLVLIALRLMRIALPPLGVAALCGMLAASLSWWMLMDRWWLAIQLLFAPALVLMLLLDLRPGIYLLLFLLLLLIYWSSFQTRVPLYISGQQTFHALDVLLPAQAPGQRCRFVDLGSGLGGVVLHLARRRPDADFHGVELAPLPAMISWLRVAVSGLPNARIRWGSFWRIDLAAYDVVFAFLSPVPMEQLWTKARSEMRPGTLFVSSSFAIPGQQPERSIDVADRKRTRLLVFRM